MIQTHTRFNRMLFCVFGSWHVHTVTRQYIDLLEILKVGIRSGFSVPFFTFGSKPIDSLRMVTCVVCLPQTVCVYFCVCVCVCVCIYIYIYLQGTFLVNQAVGRAVAEAKLKSASIVNISSIVGKVSQSHCSFLWHCSTSLSLSLSFCLFYVCVWVGITYFIFYLIIINNSYKML